MPPINHFIVLLLENRSLDHLFGFFPPPAGEKIENLLALDSLPTNLLDPSKAPSDDNPSFEECLPPTIGESPTLRCQHGCPQSTLPVRGLEMGG